MGMFAIGRSPSQRSPSPSVNLRRREDIEDIEDSGIDVSNTAPKLSTWMTGKGAVFKETTAVLVREGPALRHSTKAS